MTARYLCIHGHFYQPPRENPWLEAVELQDSAYPYHDWNERITAECYAPNGVARILDADSRIARLANNYSRISFNFGPTLLSWLQDKNPDVYRAILAADRDSLDLFGGHGSALAQVFNHVIMPLASRRDKVTQVVWGLRDFEHRFGRRPEGMWLAETAVDLETLDVLAEHGLRFTVLAPSQAKRIRPLGQADWEDVSGSRIDPSRAYLHKLPSGRSINLFFYDGPISRAVAFERLLSRGEDLVARVLGGFHDDRTWPQLVHIATDGESYGHHHAHGDMALAAALDFLDALPGIELTNYGQFLELHLPTHEVEIHENTSWSCAHGIERWRADCGCSSGRPGWNQAWRAPLRQALDWLRNAVAPLYERAAGQVFRDPWAARDDAILFYLDPVPETFQRFLREHALRELDESARIAVRKLLELQRQTQLMYTSCGWFFDDLSGIETVQVLQYAGRAIQLAGELFGEDLEEGFLSRLGKAKSNVAEHGDGRAVYERFVKSAAVGWEQIGAHYAVSSLFESYPEQTRFFCYTADQEAHQVLAAGRSRLVAGKVRIRSEVTHEAARLCYGVLHLGDHHVNGGVEALDDETFARFVDEAGGAFQRGDFAEVIRALDRSFGESTYTLRSLFRDEQRKVIKQVLHASVVEAETSFRRLYEHHLPTMRFLAGLGVPFPRVFEVTAEFLLNTDLRWDIKDEEPDLEHIRALFREARTLHVRLDTAGLGYKLKRTLARMAERLREQPSNLPLLSTLAEVVELARSLPFAVDFWQPQNVVCELALTTFPELVRQLEEGDKAVESWLTAFLQLAGRLGVRVVDLRHQLEEARTMPSATDLVRAVLAERRVPRATYRVQLNRDFGFRHVQEQADYLRQLGVSDVYLSPILQARPGSTHGYDVCDPSRLNPDLGGEPAFDALSAALRERGLGVVLDMVPNHMGIGHNNPWWYDVLENGPASVHAGYFDIDWEPVNPNLRNKLMVPLLEDQYGTVLEAGKIHLAFDRGAFVLHYYDHRLPISPCTYPLILRHTLDILIRTLGEEHEQVRELQSILTALSYLPPRTEKAHEKIVERNREKEVIKERLARLAGRGKAVPSAVAETLRAFNGKVGVPESFDLLDGLLEAQAYRLAFWRVAAEDINYRRFFDINELAALRVEKPDVFEAVHALFFSLLAEGKATGLRIDHPDGLWNPTRYFRELQRRYVLARVRRRLAPRRLPEPVEAEVLARVDDYLGQERHGPGAWPLYVVAEKILSTGEELPRDWPVDGTTGYDFLNLVNGLFVDRNSAEAVERAYATFTGGIHRFATLSLQTRKMIMLVSMASELNSLGHRLDRLSERNRRYRDFTLNSLTFATREILACLPVYRTYTSEPGDNGEAPVSARDRSVIEAAVEQAKTLNPRTAESIFDFIRDVLLLRVLPDFREEDRPQLVEWVMKFQQVSGPVMAKGVEDTAIYVHNRLVSLNEVGGHPEHFGVAPEEFHAANQERARLWPHAMLATSTHDTKRGEDVRARLDVLSELSGEWQDAVNRWQRQNAPHKTVVDGYPAPDRNDEYLLYQTLLGIWPAEPPTAKGYASLRERVAAYMQKATKEAKVHTSWINANVEYDQAVRDFVHGILPESVPDDPFLSELQTLARRVAWFGYWNGLSQVLLKVASPGVPDFYQGSELWDLNLVDPDNRRPVDFARRRELLRELAEAVTRQSGDRRALARDLLAAVADGRIKLYVTWQALTFRRDHERLFAEGDYIPLEAAGAKKDHVCAFMRKRDGATALVVVPRLVAGLTGGAEQPPLGPAWDDTWLLLPPEERGQTYRQQFTGETFVVAERDGGWGLPLSAVLGTFPLALLGRVTAGQDGAAPAR